MQGNSRELAGIIPALWSGSVNLITINNHRAGRCKGDSRWDPGKLRTAMVHFTLRWDFTGVSKREILSTFRLSASWLAPQLSRDFFHARPRETDDLTACNDAIAVQSVGGKENYTSLRLNFIR